MARRSPGTALGAALAAGCLALTPARPASAALLPGLGQTPSGAVYHAARCTAAAASTRIVVFLPGTAVAPTGAQIFVRTMGDRTGLCAMAIPYSNSGAAATCCSATALPDGPQDPACLDALLGAKAYGQPPTVACLDGSALTVTPSESIAGSLTTALGELELTGALRMVGGELAPRWERIVLTGHSQGAMLAAFVGLGGHDLAGIGSIAGGSLHTAGPSPWPAFVTGPPATVPSRHRAFHHVDDADAGRRAAFAAMSVPPRNLRTTASTAPSCLASPHSCVVVDGQIPFAGEQPEFADDWAWLVTPSPGGCPSPAPASVLESARLRLARVGGSPGDDVLSLRGRVSESGVSLAGARPDLFGGRLAISAADETVLVDVTLPAGAFGGKGTAGWVGTPAGSRWIFLDRTTASGPRPVSKLRVSSPRAGGLRVVVRGSRATYPVSAADLPLSVAVQLGDPVAEAGVCAERDFSSCAGSASATRIVCRR